MVHPRIRSLCLAGVLGVGACQAPGGAEDGPGGDAGPHAARDGGHLPAGGGGGGRVVGVDGAGPGPAQTDAGAPAQGADCDHSRVRTRDLPPDCPYPTVAGVAGATWSGECVPLGECGCDVPGSQAQCGDGLSYVCHADGRCGDLL